MKNHFTITISDAHGARHYTFNQLVKRFFWWGLVALAVLVLLSVTYMMLLNHEVELLHQRREAAVQRYEQTLGRLAQMLSALQQRNNALSAQLEEKGARLAQLDASVKAIEAMLGAAPAAELPLEARIARVHVDAGTKRYLLQVIPNGHPVLRFVGISSRFGWRKHPVTGNREFHKGLDYRGRTGDKVIATADGVVEYAGYHKASGYGKMVLLDHAFGFRSLYGHLSKVLVKNGEVVHKGQVIGLMGNTGLSTGSHLHYQLSFIQRALDPRPFTHWTLQDFRSIFKQVRQVPWDSLANQASRYVRELAPPSSPKAASSAEK
ncbi:peptidoglycan DD-metalloendopeptidase family protein [Sulfurivirga sp.]|uniref:M23 family metallopeptidase n=1 Tax=Sulfurivirga sp. TaxID=2614236 RepID=UPI0025CD9BA4|nr:peptidoglycan DD-metalloendopeptidase family protein [Sulfurivirga sp.]